MTQTPRLRISTSGLTLLSLRQLTSSLTLLYLQNQLALVHLLKSLHHTLTLSNLLDPVISISALLKLTSR